jgi:hypothetical protein
VSTNNKSNSSRRTATSLPLMLANSTAIAGAVVGAVVGLSGCENADTNQNLNSVRDEYKNIEDCKEDWGSIDPCQPEKGAQNGNNLTGTSGGSHGYTGRYFGPSYFDGQRESAQRSYFGSQNGASRSIISDHSVSRSISRGGFGTSSHGFSGGG